MDLDGICVKVERRPGGIYLVPADIHAEEECEKLLGREIVVHFETPRNPKHHRWFFLYLKRVIENTDEIWADVGELLVAVKYAVGHTTKSRAITLPNPEDEALAKELVTERLYQRTREGEFVMLPFGKLATILRALRRGSDEWLVQVKSISFASMGQEKFAVFADNAMDKISRFLGWDTSTLMPKRDE